MCFEMYCLLINFCFKHFALQNYNFFCIYARKNALSVNLSAFFLFPGQIFSPIVFVNQPNRVAHPSWIP